MLTIQVATAEDKIESFEESDDMVILSPIGNEPIRVINDFEMEGLLSLVEEERATTERELEGYIAELTGLSDEAIGKLIKQSEVIGIDVFLLLGIIRVESNFDPYVVGALGERGLGQLMANTARPVANNMGIAYDPELLFDPEYNILLFTTQLKYLYDFYNGDIHMTLSSYNRGQYGLEKYMASRNGYTNPAMSTYSVTILEYANTYRIEFDNY
jgi:soluble lytic murein transglycosylase-like protein